MNAIPGNLFPRNVPSVWRLFRYGNVTKNHGRDVPICRAYCSVETENANAAESTRVARRAREMGYIRNIMKNPEKYPEVNIDENSFSVNAHSTNALLLLLRNFANNCEACHNLSELDFGSDEFNESLCSANELIEVFYLLSKCKPRNILKEYHSDALQKLFIKNCRALKALGASEKISLLLLMGNNTDILRRNLYSYGIEIRSFARLTNSQLVQYFYSLYPWKTLPDHKNQKNINILQEKISELSVSELVVILNSYMLSRTKGRIDLTEKVLLRCLEEMDNVNDIELAVICKFLQNSLNKKLAGRIQELYRKFSAVMSKFTLTTCIHVCCAGIGVNIGSTKLIRQTLERVVEEAEDGLRLKDLERLLLATVFFNFELRKDSNFVNFFVKQLEERENEIMLYPRAFLSYVEYLIIHGIFLEDKVNFALSEDFGALLHKKYGTNIFRQLIFFDATIELERPSYEGNRLNPRLRQKICAACVFLPSTRRDAKSNVCLYEIEEELSRIYGDDNIVSVQILPHYANYQSVLCLNRKNEPQKIGDLLKASRGTLIRAPSDGNRWICFVVLRSQGCLEDCVTPNFVSLAKLKHLRTAGYIPIVIPAFLWLGKTRQDKSEYIEVLLRINNLYPTVNIPNHELSVTA